MSNSDGKDRVAVITGATKGLGRELSLAFGEAGYEVVGVYRSDSTSAEVIGSEFRAKNLRGCFVTQDISEDGNWTEFDKIIDENRSKPFTLIANASHGFAPKPFHLNKWNEISDLLDVNVKGTFSVLKRILPYMVKTRSGTFISILSSAVKTHPKGFAGYITAKSALEGLTKAAAAEYSERGLRIFSVSPGFMKTALTEAWSDHLQTLIGSRDDLSTFSPVEVAREILALAEDPQTKGQGENYCLDGLH